MPYGNKEFFSDDAIQRIARGNEPTQTLISIDVLKNVLNPHQLRNVLGGSGYPYCCCFCTWNAESYCGYCGVGTKDQCEDTLNNGEWGKADCYCTCTDT